MNIPKPIYDAVIQHARERKPIESCGYLAGIGETVTRFIPMTNVDNQPDHFSFDPKEQFQAVKSVRGTGEALIVVYHSHPETPARLSAEDIRLFNDPNMVYLIVSLQFDVPVVNAYRLKKNAPMDVVITPVPIQITHG